MPVLKTVRKINVYDKGNVFLFQGIWPQVFHIFRVGFFKIVTFSEHLLPTACKYSKFLPFIKIKNQNIEAIGDKKSVLNLKSKSKLVNF